MENPIRKKSSNRKVAGDNGGARAAMESLTKSGRSRAPGKDPLTHSSYSPLGFVLRKFKPRKRRKNNADSGVVLLSGNGGHYRTSDIDSTYTVSARRPSHGSKNGIPVKRPTGNLLERKKANSLSFVASGVICGLILSLAVVGVGFSPKTKAKREKQPKESFSILAAVTPKNSEAEEINTTTDSNANNPASSHFFSEALREISDVIPSVSEALPTVSFEKAEPQIAPPPQIAMLQPAAAVAPKDKPRDPSIDERIGKIKFISGMIAIHLPTIQDCGAVAKDIVEISSQKGIDPMYVAAIISVESRFGATAKSKSGALGLMQILPSTARHLVKTSTGKSFAPELTDPRTNIRLGVDYIIQLERRYKGNHFLALAAYNWGLGNVDVTLKNGGQGIPGSVQKYARTVLERAKSWKNHYKNAEKSARKLADAQIAENSVG